MTITTGRKFFNDHMQYIADKDMTSMVVNTYTEDAVFYNPFPFLDTPPPNVIQGSEKLIEACDAFLDYQGDVRLESLENFLETEDVISFQAVITSSKTGKWAVGDVWLMENGKIARHFGVAHKLKNS